jgi:osmoprotectant transport system ATP-binding protein
MISLQNVTKIFPGSKIPAVNKLSLEVGEGEICVLVGPSGCGKTTTMKMVNRLYEPTSGKIYLNGEDIMQVNPINLRRGIGYVIQEIGLFPHLTIEENVATVPRELKWSKDKIKARVEELLRLVGLDPDIYAKRRPPALSGGQRQRVGVARAMAADPPVLLMDEPFGAVDPITRGRLQNEFLRLQEKIKKTIIFVTHDIDEAIKMGNKIAAMREGRLVQFATPDELLSSPKDEFVARLVGRNRSIKRLHLIRAEAALQKTISCVNLNDTADKIQKHIEDNPMNVVIVVDDQRRLKGVISQKDLETDNFKDNIGDIKAADLYDELANYSTHDSTLNDVLSVMLNYGEGYVAIIDEKERFQGIITLGDILEVVKDDASPAA